MLGAVGCVAAVGLGIKGVLAYFRAEKARLEAVFDQNPGWSREPLHVPEGTRFPGARNWSAYGRNEQGVVWELYLESREDEPDQLVFRTPNLKLPRLELVIVGKGELSKMLEALQLLDGVIDSFLGKMALKMANKFTARLGVDLEDLRSFVKSAEEAPVGSQAFQAHHTVLTRGQLPLDKMIRPETEALMQALGRHKLGLRWGASGLYLHLNCSRRQLGRLAPQLVHLGGLLTEAAGYTG